VEGCTAWLPDGGHLHLCPEAIMLNELNPHAKPWHQRFCDRGMSPGSWEEGAFDG